jgi:hypothetical protein
MPKVTMNNADQGPADDTASALVKASGDTEMLTDSKGRKIRTRLPGILEEYELMAAIGGSEAANPATAGMARITLYVAQIDDVAIVVPRTRLAMLAILKQLGNEGLKAVMPIAVKHQAKFQVDEALLKNS